MIDYEVNIFDMQLKTKKKSSEEIKKMIIKQFWKLDSKLNESDYELNYEYKYFTVKCSNRDASIEDPYRIKNRRKYEKLSGEQIRFLKQLLCKDESKKSIISRIYRVSPSTLSSIKNTNDYTIFQLPRRNLSKINDKDKVQFLKPF